MTEPLVTVVIPTIKPRRGLLRRAVNSVMAQDMGDYPKPLIEIGIDREHDGAAETRNRALLKATTPWVAFLDDDDYFMPNHLRTLLDAQNNFDLGDHEVYYTGCRVIGPEFQEIPLQEEWGRFGKPFSEESLRASSCLPVTSLVNTEYAQQALFGPPNHDKTCPYDDWGFYLRMLDLGATFLAIPEVTWVWHHHGRNTSGQGDRW